MADPVVAALAKHLEDVRDALPPNKRLTPPEMMRHCEEAECHGPFHALARACLSTLAVPEGRFSSSTVDTSAWSRALTSFLRRTGAYASNSPNPHTPESLVAKLREEVSRRTCKLKHFAMLDNISLARKEIDWKVFKLVWLDEAKLKRALDFETRAQFYPRTLEGFERYRNHYFLEVEEEVANGIRGAFRGFDDLLSSRVRIHATALPSAIEKALRPLVLHDWQPPWHVDDQVAPMKSQIGWCSFRIPAVIAISDDLLDSPRSLPHTHDIDMEPFIDQEGEELGETPGRPIHELDEEATNNLERSVTEYIKDLSRLQSKQHAQFVHNAVDFLVKAFVSREAEQLIWHVVAIEAALGGAENEPVRATIRKRIGPILAGPRGGAKAVCREFNQLYDVRSAFVHGSPQKEDAFKGHVTSSRRLSRSVVAWIVRSFAFLDEKGAATPSLQPTRADLLRLAEMTEEERIRTGEQLAWLPKGFPAVADWTR